MRDLKLKSGFSLMVWPSREKFLFIKKFSSKSFACLQKPVALIVKTLMKPLVGVKDCSLTYHKVNHSRPSTHKRRAIANNSKKHLFHIIHGLETILETDSTVKAVQKRLMFIEHSTYHLWKILIIGCYLRVFASLGRNWNISLQIS